MSDLFQAFGNYTKAYADTIGFIDVAEDARRQANLAALNEIVVDTLDAMARRKRREAADILHREENGGDHDQE